MTGENPLLWLLRVDGPAASLDPSTIDWDELLLTTGRHGVPGLVTGALKTLHVTPPPEAARQLAVLHRRAIADGLRVERTRDRVLAILPSAGLHDVAVLKGAALIPRLYGGPGARRVNDVDLLVRVRDRERVHRALISAGFRHVPKPPGRPASQRLAYERSYARDGDVLVDVHTAFAEPARLVLDHDAVLDRARRGAQGELVLTDEDMLLSLVVHLGQDCFAGPLRSLVDVATFLVRCEPDLDVTAERARECGAATLLWLALALARDRLAAPVPAGLLLSLRPPWLRRHYLERLYSGRGPAPYPFLHRKRWAQALTLYPLMDDGRVRARFTIRYLRTRARDLYETASALSERR